MWYESNISKSIDLNIIGTANLVKICQKFKIKIIYFSTNYVYECTKGNYKEKDPVKPFNNSSPIAIMATVFIYIESKLYLHRDQPINHLILYRMPHYKIENSK